MPIVDAFKTNEGRLVFVAETIKNIHLAHASPQQGLTVGDKNVDPLLERLSPAHLAASEVVAGAGRKNRQPRLGVDWRWELLPAAC